MPLDTQRKKIKHLLRRAGLGASPAEVEAYTALGLKKAVVRLLDYHKLSEPYSLDVSLFKNDKGQLNAAAVGMWWVFRMLTTTRPLEQKMTLFWHDHFACSGEKVKPGPLLHTHLELLRKNALGNFRQILGQTAKDTTMLMFLDGVTNVKSQPNENFAREVMELYTMGIGNYTEDDIAQAARAFTGWSIERRTKQEREANKLPNFVFRERLHDAGQKDFLGQTGNFDGDDVLDILARKPETASYICTKLWEWFAYPDPEPAVVDRLAQTFMQSNGNIKTVLKAIFTADEFYSARAERGLYKSPVDFVIASLRAINIAEILEQAKENAANSKQLKSVYGGALRRVYFAMNNMGQQLLFPPTVAGWDGGSAWINSATMLERIKFADIYKPGKRAINATALLGSEKHESIAAAVDQIASVLDAPLDAAQREAIIQVAQTELVDGLGVQKDLRQRIAYQIVRLIFATPQFQFC